MKRLFYITAILCLATAQTLLAQTNDTINFSGNNSSSDYITYSTAVSVPAGKTVDVMMARYCYFSSTVSGKGTINLHAGGERCYLGTKSGASWANWTNFKGDAHIYPFKENSSSAGSYNIVLAHGGKVFSPENIDDCIKGGKLNNAMQNCKVTVHSGAILCNEANNANAGGFRIGELQMEAGSTLQGYMKKDRKSYYLVGNLNTDAILAGKIVPNEGSILGLIKEGTGTYRITGNQNSLTGALRVKAGKVLVNNDRAEAESKKYSGGLGAMSSENTPIAYVFGNGILGGTGSIGGAVDNYGTIEPGDETPGTLTLKNYASPTKNANLTVHPASVLRFKVASADSYDQLIVAGTVKYSSCMEDFSTSDNLPVIELVIDEQAEFHVGDAFTLLTAKSKSDDLQFRLQQPGKGTWELEDQTDSDRPCVTAIWSRRSSESIWYSQSKRRIQVSIR
jgi:autotransporter-associated beta strand protein